MNFHVIRYIAEKRGVSIEKAREIWAAVIATPTTDDPVEDIALTDKRKRPRPEPAPQVTHREVKLTTR